MTTPPSNQDNDEIGKLIVKSLSGLTTEEEEVKLSEWLSISIENQEFYKNMQNEIHQKLNTEVNIWKKIEQSKDEKNSLDKRFGRNKTKYIAIAASVLLITSFIIRFQRHKSELEFAFQSYSYNSSDAIILTLADGKNINIDSISSGIKQSNALITFSGNSVIYVPQKNVFIQEYNKLTTSFGKQSKIILPDGSKVWLNACSSILFPTAFDKELRKVQLIGEAFFEVETITDSTIADGKVPFLVELKGGNYINVTGTKFNVTAYVDEDIKTTLIEGGVEVQNNSNKKKIVPGEQAVINSPGEIAVYQIKDISEIFSWKEGIFNYNNTPITQVMADISRWYNVKIEYKNYVSNHLTIKVPRGITLHDLLNLLQMNSSIRFEISDKKVIVTI